MTSEWKDVDHALAYLARADGIPHRVEGEAALLEHIHSPRLGRELLDDSLPESAAMFAEGFGCGRFIGHASPQNLSKENIR